MLIKKSQPLEEKYTDPPFSSLRVLGLQCEKCITPICIVYLYTIYKIVIFQGVIICLIIYSGFSDYNLWGNRVFSPGDCHSRIVILDASEG
ncbi:hypothetical protein BDZ94DRAFT_1250436 [Collybia nuda]|uniref:Uncharacterized protein n=1 Tax=Collybia nuda TaxID=64659 RepID=A0A9P5YDI0_9AGAR|nr:hypothetical protein BDZ94DRAFT_1250436 [Collybia nuda]